MDGRRLFCLTMLAAALLFAAGCAGRTYLNVGYTLPAAEPVLAGRAVALEVRDLRSRGATLTPAAAEVLKGFRDRYVLVPSGGGRSPGTHDLANLFAEAFRRRLTAMGAVVAEAKTPGMPLMRVEISDFLVDTADRRWTVRAACRAVLTRDNGAFADETVTGSAERLRVLGRDGSDDLVGELFTDIVNRLDIAALFHRAGLL